MTYTPLVIPVLIAVIVSLILSAYAWRRRETPGAKTFALLLLLGAEWLITYILSLMNTELPGKLIWAKAEYIGIVSVPVLSLVFILQYTGLQKWLMPRRLMWLAIIPIITLLLTWTNEAHGLIWAEYDRYWTGSVMLWKATYGAWFWVATTYNYLLILIGAILILRMAISSFPLYRYQAITLLGCSLVPILGSAIYIFYLRSVPSLNPTPFALTLSEIMLALGLFRFRLLDVVPVPRGAVFEGMTDGLIVLDRQNRILDMNLAAQHIIGLMPTKVIGQPISRVLPRWADWTEQPDGLIATQREIALRAEEPERFYNLLLSLLRQRHGFAGNRIVVLRDITEQKLMREKLQELYLRERQLRAELEAEIKKKAEFTRMLVHELKTPLTAVLSSSELLATHLIEEPWLSLARNINEGGYKLNRRIDELLDLARGEIGMLHLRAAQIDPLHLLQQTAQGIAPLVSQHGQHFVLDLPSSLPTIWADEDRLQQVLLNLLHNALKFTPEGGIITLRARQKDTTLVVEVQDTGCGISEEEKPRLFQPYDQVDSARGHSGGLKLGLVLSRMLVELHGGKMWVESQEGKGSTFSFSVPLDNGLKSLEDRR